MASFDPSVISTIPDNGPDPIAAKGRAYTLASLIDQQQLGRMKLNQEQSEQKDLGKIRDILSKSDLSTYEGQNKASEAAIKVNPKLGMDLQRGFAARQSAKYEKETQDLKVFALQQDHIAGALDSVLAEADTMRREGKSDALVNAKITASTLEQVERLKGMQLPNGQPVLSPQVMQQLAQQMGQGPLTYDKLRAIEAQSNKGQQLIKERLAERGQQVKEASESEKERHDRVMEDAAAKKAGANFTPEMGALMAALAEKGVSLPTGFRSKEQQATLYKGLLNRNPGKSADEIADAVKSGKLKLTAESKGAQVAGSQIGKVALAANELDTFGDQTLEASRALPRGAFGLNKSLTINGLIQMGEKEVSSQPLLRLRTKLIALNNAYDQLAARGGTDVEKRAHARELFNSRLSDDAIQTLVKSLKEEAEGARQAANKTIAETSDSSIPGTGGAASGTVKPYDDADKEARYQAWKKAHGG